MRLKLASNIIPILTIICLAFSNACTSSDLTTNTVNVTEETPTLIKTTATITAEQYYQQALLSVEKNQFEQAVSDLNQAIRLDPQFTDAYCERSKIFAYQNEWDKVSEECSKAIEIDPGCLTTYYIRGIYYIWQKNYVKAFDNLNIASTILSEPDKMDDLKRITDLVIKPGEIILLKATEITDGGSDCHGNYMPYNTTIHLILFLNPGESKIEISKIRIYPGVEGKSVLNSPIKYCNNIGTEHIVINISSFAAPASKSNCSIEYKSAEETSYKKSNEITAEKSSFHY